MKKLTDEQVENFVNDVKSIVKQWSSQKTNILTILFAVFVTLKLTGHISWSWWWVTAPLWGGVALFITIITLIIIMLFLVYLFK